MRKFAKFSVLQKIHQNFCVKILPQKLINGKYAVFACVTLGVDGVDEVFYLNYCNCYVAIHVASLLHEARLFCSASAYTLLLVQAINKHLE